MARKSGTWRPIAGSGAGKTTQNYHSALQIVPNVLGAWLFDLRKREFIRTQRPLEALGVPLVVLAAGDLKINPLQVPDGVAVSDWVPRVSDMLVQVLVLPSRATKLLQTTLLNIYPKFQDTHLYPTLYDLFAAVKSNRESNPQARKAVLDSLEPILLSLGPTVLAYRAGWTCSELAKHVIAFELGALAETAKNLVLNTLLLSEFCSRIARGVSNPKMDLWICVDEAARLCSSSSQFFAIGDIIGLVRGTGIGLDLSLQGTHGLLPQVVSNTATKVLGRCGSITDYTTFGHCMGLSAEQIHWAQMNLEPGLFSGQFGEGPWRYPFVFRVPPLNLPALTTDATPGLGPLAELPVVCAAEFDTWGTESKIELSGQAEPSTRLFGHEREYRFCRAVVERPMQPSSAYPKLAGISSKYAKHVREQLIRMGYVREHRIDSGARGRSAILLEALPKGIEAVQAYGRTGT